MDKNEMRKLFLSWGATINALNNGTVTVEDLRHGLFYLGCSRSGLADEKYLSRIPQDLLPAVLDAVAEANRYSRAAWKQRWMGDGKYWRNYEQLNQLLVANNYQPLDVEECDRRSGTFNNGVVSDLVDKRLEVVG